MRRRNGATEQGAVDMTQTADVIIIGAGVIGAAIGCEMSRAGFSTLNIDRNHDAGAGSTSGSCAIIRVHYSTLEGSAFAYEGFFDWQDWPAYLQATDEQGLARFIQCGCLVMETPANGHMARHKEICRTLGIPFEEWNAAAIRSRLPPYDLTSFAPARRIDDPAFGRPNGSRIGGAVFFPTAGYVTDPQLSAHNLRRAAEAAGGRFLFNRSVTGILTRGGRVAGVALEGGEEIHAPVVINVAGPASHRINAMAGVTEDMNITTRPLRQEVAHVPQPDGFDFERQGLVVSDGDIACYARPEHGGNILIGSEDPECDPREFVDDEDFNRDFTDQWTNQVHRYALRVPDLPIPRRPRGVVELYDVTEDWIPIYDRSCLPGFYMACGTSGNQYKNATVAARLMTGLVSYCENGGDHDTRPFRFDLPRAGFQLDTSFFSRRRRVNPESSNSVLG